MHQKAPAHHHHHYHRSTALHHIEWERSLRLACPHAHALHGAMHACPLSLPDSVCICVCAMQNGSWRGQNWCSRQNTQAQLCSSIGNMHLDSDVAGRLRGKNPRRRNRRTQAKAQASNESKTPRTRNAVCVHPLARSHTDTETNHQAQPTAPKMIQYLAALDRLKIGCCRLPCPGKRAGENCESRSRAETWACCQTSTAAGVHR